MKNKTINLISTFILLLFLITTIQFNTPVQAASPNGSQIELSAQKILSIEDEIKYITLGNHKYEVVNDIITKIYYEGSYRNKEEILKLREHYEDLNTLIKNIEGQWPERIKLIDGANFILQASSNGQKFCEYELVANGSLWLIWDVNNQFRFSVAYDKVYEPDKTQEKWLIYKVNEYLSVEIPAYNAEIKEVEGYKNQLAQPLMKNINTIIDADLNLIGSVVKVKRLAGFNRIETSIAIAKDQYTDKVPDAVVLVTANNFPDALAGSGLAYKYNAPLLLVDTTVNNSKNVLNYITTNLAKNKNIYVLGGADVVSKDIADYLITKGYKIIRLEGKDRYETNQKIVNYMNIPKGTSIVLATGGSFADALSISSIAAIKDFPILLNSKDTLLANVCNDITNIQPTTVYLIGDIGVLSTNIETQIKHLNCNIEIVRLGGLTRYDTSMKILDYFNLSTTTVTVATGFNFPDALSGSVLAARNNCGVLLVDNKDVTKQKELLNKQNITNLIVFGGDDVVSNTIANSLIQ